MNRPSNLVSALAAALLLSACATPPSGLQPRGIDPASLPFELERFMGDWYVIAHMPLSVEADAHEAVETYTLREDGEIDVRFRFCEGALDGPPKEFGMRAWVHDPATNAEWRVRPFWPLRLDYQILELAPDFSLTVIGHPSGSYAWVMAREPRLDEALLGAITKRLAERGYEVERMRRVPHADGSCREAP